MTKLEVTHHVIQHLMYCFNDSKAIKYSFGMEGPRLYFHTARNQKHFQGLIFG